MSPTRHAGDQADKSAGQVGSLAPADECVGQGGRLAAAGLLAAAGGLHLAALPGHLGESTVAGAFFAATAAAQLLGAVLVGTRPSLRTYRAVVAGNVGVLTLWLMSRTIGLPHDGGPGVSEPFGLLDGFAAAAEALVVVAGVAAIVRRAAPSGRRPGARRLALALALTWGLAGGTGLAVAGDGHHGDAHTHGQPGRTPLTEPGRTPLTEPGCPAAHGCSDHPH